ncbi:sphingomyelin phosphodiesterase 4, neutral membrane (neutral sphingomyelinase-3) [Podila humilis]|nr:sphingomyelin phosphodiesterase 4, neutral membrane (neutral sphingomyelinase-3) [Podila humilis]
MLEYFLFYFAYALTLDDDEDNNRMIKRSEPKMTFRILGLAPTTQSQSTVGYQRSPPKPLFIRLAHGPYFNLYEDYLRYFLPEPEKTTTMPKSTTTSGPKDRPFSIFTDPAIENSVNRQQTQLAITEFFIGTAVELWLGQNDPNVNNVTIRYIQPGGSMSICVNELVSHLLSYDISQYRHGGEVAPSHVAAVARRSAYQVLRPKLYTFLRAGLKFWPLDETFPRLVDVWVNWLTPWHYGRPESLNNKDTAIVKEQWYCIKMQPIIFENLLFYTTLLELFLPRLSMPTQSNRPLTGPGPLSPSRELRQLRKVLNVYKAEHLKEILKVAEQVVMTPERFTESTFHNFDVSDSGRDATSAFLSSMAINLPTLMYQMEGPDFRYRALFLPEGLGRTAIRQVLTKLGNEVNARQGKLAAIQAKNKASAAENVIWIQLSSLFDTSAPKPATGKEVEMLVSESNNMRETMKDVATVFSLDPAFVETFERRQDTSRGQGSAGVGGAGGGAGGLSAEQIEALMAPIEDMEEEDSVRTAQRQQQEQQGQIVVGDYDAHVQPVYQWERPDQSERSVAGGGGRHRHRQQQEQEQEQRQHQQQQRKRGGSTGTMEAQPQYTIELAGV